MVFPLLKDENSVVETPLASVDKALRFFWADATSSSCKALIRAELRAGGLFSFISVEIPLTDRRFLRGAAISMSTFPKLFSGTTPLLLFCMRGMRELRRFFTTTGSSTSDSSGMMSLKSSEAKAGALTDDIRRFAARVTGASGLLFKRFGDEADSRRLLRLAFKLLTASAILLADTLISLICIMSASLVQSAKGARRLLIGL